MVNKLEVIDKYPTVYRKCVMDSEWELLQVIHRLMAKMNESSKLK